jgi:proton-translocating NADH-quinone oxidoreductase chain N
MSTPAFIWLIGLLLAASPLIYLAGRLGQRLGLRSLSPALGLLVLLVAWLPFTMAVFELDGQAALAYTLGSVTLQLDGLSLLLAAVALGLGTLVTLYSGPYLAGEDGQEKYYAMLVAMVGVMIGLGCAADLFNLWIWFEAMAVSSYLLVAFYHEQPASLEAGLKYLVQSSAGSVLVLVGISVVFSQAGSLSLSALRTLPSTTLCLAAGALFVIGFGVKAALVPMHTWLPDAHSQAPSGISAMLSGVVIEAGLIALLRVISNLMGVTPSWGPILMGFGALNMLAGNLLALQQTQVKRLLAYSSLAHVGYMLAGLGIALYSGQAAGAQGAFFHLFNHGLMKGLAFLAAGALLYSLHLAVGDHAPLTVTDLAGASRRYPLAALAFSVAVLALGGLPPLAGFMSKWQIFVAGFDTQNGWIGALVVFAALNSVLSLAYYAPLINAVYRLEPSPAVRAGRAMPRLMGAPLVILALAVIALGFWPSLLNWLTLPAGQALLKALPVSIALY